MMAGYMGTSPAQGASEELPVYSPPYPNSTLNADSRSRQYHCWLHGYNNSHNGSDCRVMAANEEDTVAMQAARSSTGTGGNPNVGVLVHFTRFPKSFFRLHCAPCPPPPPTFSPPTSSTSQDSSARKPPQLYDDISQAQTKNTSELAVSEGYNFASLARMRQSCQSPQPCVAYTVTTFYLIPVFLLSVITFYLILVCLLSLLL
jgi:hypothetical protein